MVLTSSYGDPILGSSDLPTIGKNRCSRNWVNKTEAPKILLMTKEGFKITLNRELNNKLIQKSILLSTAHESRFRDKQKFHSEP
jgi:hypothetical protein